MPISGYGWEIHFLRDDTHSRHSDGKVRTVGRYQIYHDGVPASGSDMNGMFAETRGPGDNSTVGNNRRIEEGIYTLRTQGGTKYKTHDYTSSASSSAIPRPGIELRGCAPRTEILIHPGRGYLSSIGCINLCTNLPDASEPITYKSSRRRVISMLDDLSQFLGSSFPDDNERPVPNALVVIDGEP
ncbi:hypothetical protein [uncultured Roseobacter sp.]|uniref:hypothetical protein n=1 Tax=uncultured Roseobacter sp. TaxID=114847 RepID=UPI0026378BD0|nr:hypothetical protein [uncultured Roseobacter sp.]